VLRAPESMSLSVKPATSAPTCAQINQ
jgi:hypothetical protein